LIRVFAWAKFWQGNSTFSLVVLNAV
jgi:hypothetical protein